MADIRGKYREFAALLTDASRHYQRNRLILLVQILWLRVLHDQMLKEIRLMGLLGEITELTRHSRNLSNRRLQKWLLRTNPVTHRGQVDIKSRFYQHCRQAGIPVPDTYAVGHPSVELLDTLPDRFFVKPLFGGGGYGTSAFERRNDRFVSWEGKSYSSGELVTFIARSAGNREMVYQEWLKTHNRLTELSRHALITVRTITYIPPFGPPDPHLVSAYLRVPAKESLVDNMGYAESGQAMIEINVAAGSLLRSWMVHPSGFGVVSSDRARLDNGPFIASLEIPDWKSVADISLRIAKSFPSTRSLGLDIGITGRGPVAIEGNTAWGAHLYPSGLQRIHEIMKV